MESIIQYFQEDFILTGPLQYTFAIVGFLSTCGCLLLWILFFLNPKKINRQKHLVWYCMVLHMRSKREEKNHNTGKRNEWMMLTVSTFFAIVIFFLSPYYKEENLVEYSFMACLAALPMFWRYIGMIMTYREINKYTK